MEPSRAPAVFTRMIDTIRYLGLLGDEDIELDTAALALSALDHDGIDLAPYVALLSSIGAKLAVLGAGANEGAEQAGVLAEILHDDFGFSGDRESYDAPLNADMVRVLDRRRGLPVSLSIIYVAAARRLGWSADALNTPMHVLVGIGSGDARILIDPFNDGAQVMPEQLLALLSQAPGPGSFPTEAHVGPMTNRETLVRLLLNQATRAEQAGDPGRALTVYERMTIVAPSHGQGWWDLARLQLVAGAVDPARASLSAMLEVTRDPERRRQITDTLHRLSAG